MKKLVQVFFAGTALALAAATAGANIIYVNRNAAGPGDGLSWPTAFTNVQQGVSLAAPQDQVWVAAGLYLEQITLKDGVALFGGFAGTETALAQRNWKTNVTILDGNGSGTVVTVTNTSSSATRLDGFTVRNGNAYLGGGIYCGTNSTPVIANNTISQNTASHAGGGIACDSSSPFITNNIILRNTAGLMGGGVYSSYGSPLLLNNRIAVNQAFSISDLGGQGGGVWADGNPVIANNFLIANGTYYVVQPPNEFGGPGGGIYCAGSPRVINNTLLANSAGKGGGIYYEPFNSGAAMVVNNIVAFGSSGVDGALTVPGSLQSNCAYGNGGNDFGSIPNPLANNWNISVDPKLAGGGFSLDVHLSAGSPCINTGATGFVGTNWTDLDGGARIVGDSVDIGADEWDGTYIPINPRIWRASLNGNDLNDGLSWSSAKRTVQGAADAALLGGAGEVWVGAGLYQEHVDLPGYVSLCAGFGGWETNRTQRNWVTNVTVLHGKNSGTVITMGIGAGSNVISGFTIQNGETGIDCYPINGGMIANNRIINNDANSVSVTAAGIYASQGPLIIINNLLAANSRGIICDAFSTALVANNTILRMDGGGVDSYSSTPTIVNNIVAFNGFGIFNSGGSPALRNNCVSQVNAYTGVQPGTNSIEADPKLFGQWLFQPASYFLQPGSPCINAGDNSVAQPDWVDIFGRPRIQDGTVDIGAFESSSSPEWLPLIFRPTVSITTTGGITYAEFSATFTNNGFRLTGTPPVVRSGTVFSQDFRFEWFTGPTLPVATSTNGVTPLGHLPAGNYAYVIKGWGLELPFFGFSIPDDRGPTLTAGVSASGLQVGVIGVSNATYVVQTSANLKDWTSVWTNHGAPFNYLDSAGANYGQRFYRALITP